MKKRIQTAICGCEGHVEKFGKLINSYEESCTVAVWDPDRAAARRVAEEIGDCRVYEDYDELLRNPEIDGVIIVSPAVMHAEMVLKAIQAGKHIFVEKPVCIHTEDAYEIQEAVKERGVKFYMTDPFVENTTQRLKAMMEEGFFGKLISVRIKYGSLFDLGGPEGIAGKARRFGGGMMADTGGHPLHGLYYLLGMPEKVYSHFSYLDPAAEKAGYEQIVDLILEYPDHVTVSIACDTVSHGLANMIEVCGTEGAARDVSLGNHKNRLSLRRRGDAEWTVVPESELGPVPDDHVRYFIKMIAYDLPNDGVGTDPLSTHGMSIDDSVKLVELRQAIYASNDAQSLLPVAPFCKG